VVAAGLVFVLAAGAMGWATDDPLAPLPATFIGVLPCADCPGLRAHLNLFPDRSFFLRTTYLERPGIDPQDEIGSWVLSSDARILVLKGGRDAPEMLALDGQRLRILDPDGRPLPASVPSELERAQSYQPLEPRLALRGVYAYMADAGIFTECLTGQRWPVAQEGANATLEAAYVRARPGPGAGVLVSVEGRVALRPRVEGTGTQPTLIVDRFLNVWPLERCAPRFSAAPLQGTDWTLTRLGDQAISGSSPHPAPSLTLHADSPRFSGSGGCNRLMGGYVLTGDSITFGAIAGTKMACPGGMDTETAFLAALTQVRGWRVAGRLLELRDAQGAVLARFEDRTLN
jgi:copper homeostasis protein (lipoprotein)